MNRPPRPAPLPPEDERLAERLAALLVHAWRRHHAETGAAEGGEAPPPAPQEAAPS
jgi:hypothetical protein